MRKRHAAVAVFGLLATVASGLAFVQLLWLKGQDWRGGIQYEKRSTVEYWQTYSQSGAGGVHEYTEGDYPYSIEKLSSPAETFRTGYSFINQGQIYFEDRGNYRKYKPTWWGGYSQVQLPSNNNFKAGIYSFEYDYRTSVFSACKLPHKSECKTISVKSGSFPYVYARKDDSVISITNYGAALLFKDGDWCRMSMKDDVYSCPELRVAPLDKPREIQFYSSVAYQGKVLLGEWPTGRLYEFDGQTLRPSDMTPPAISAVVEQRLGYEAQSMAEYCGDLFVGYWPKGEIWRYDHRENKWHYFKRFFSQEPGEYFIPHKDRTADHLEGAFFGQRITALVPFEESLYVSTSNLRSWKIGEEVPDTVGAEKAEEYGAIYKITRAGCRTNYQVTH